MIFNIIYEANTPNSFVFLLGGVRESLSLRQPVSAAQRGRGGAEVPPL
jgi:hypothetical protein